MTLLNHVRHLKRTCMDCGKEFSAVIRGEDNKILQGAYYGELNLNTKYTYFVKLQDEDERRATERSRTEFEKWYEAHVPGYEFPESEPTVRPLWRRWWRMFLGWLPWNRNIVEMWICEDCHQEQHKRWPEEETEK